MEPSESRFRAKLITKGRRTGKSHSVMLLAVKHDKNIYFSRHLPNSDWFKNAIANPEVIIEYSKKRHPGMAKKVQDPNLERKISQLKYPGEKRAEEKRVALEVKLDEQ